MAQLFIQETEGSSNMTVSSVALCKIFEQNLSDEWLCHVAVDEGDAKYFVIISPDLGILTLKISRHQHNEFEEFFQSIPGIQQSCLDTAIIESQKRKELCDDKGDLSFPVGFGLIFPELSSGELNISIGALERFSIFSDVLNELAADDGLEDLLYDMMEDVDIIKLGDKHIENINDIVPNIFVKLKNKQINKTDNGNYDHKNNPENHFSTQLLEWFESSGYDYSDENNNYHPTSLEWRELSEHWDYAENNIRNADSNESSPSLEWWNSLENVWKEVFLKNGLTDFSTNDAIQDYLANLTKLDCSNTNIDNLEPLSGIQNLEEINCGDNRNLKSLEPLARLVNLKILNCRYTHVDSLEPLAGLINLKTLDCIRICTSDIDPLIGLTNLKTLYILSIRIKNANQLTQLANLQNFSSKSRNILDLFSTGSGPYNTRSSVHFYGDEDWGKKIWVLNGMTFGTYGVQGENGRTWSFNHSLEKATRILIFIIEGDKVLQIVKKT